MEHPIQGLMKTAMESIKSMVDVNTVVGEAVETQDGTVIIPVSRVSLGFAAGGGEYGATARDGRRPAPDGAAEIWPFGGGSGAGMSVSPIGFLVCGPNTVRFLPVDQRANLERILDVAPDLLERLQAVWRRDGHAAGNGGTVTFTPEEPVEPVHRSGWEDMD